MNKRHFKKQEVLYILDSIVGKSLGEIDSNNVFTRTSRHKKITGIAGDVIEQSVFGYKPDNKQEADITIDDTQVEIKTTGIKSNNKLKNFVAKEPMSITAVSPNKIVKEDFYNSMFWHKIENILLIYYFYDSDVTVNAAEYKDFLIKGYQFLNFSSEDLNILKKDWELVRDFIIHLQRDYVDYKSQYHRLSSELRPQLMYLDTAPKYPHPPRFRFKRSFLNSIVQNYFSESPTILNHSTHFSSFDELDKQCKLYESLYSGLTVRELLNHFEIKTERIDKSVNETIVVNMFGGSKTKINRLALFKKSGIIGKTITLTTNGKHTEDMKFFRIDFEELTDPEVIFEESTFYQYFYNQQFLAIIFQETTKNESLLDNKFVGFKRVYFTDSFIENHVLRVWKQIRTTIINNELRNITSFNRDGSPIINKNGQVRSAPNFPKSKDNDVFVRGSGTDSNVKPLTINGISMYTQYIWIKGKVIVDML